MRLTSSRFVLAPLALLIVFACSSPALALICGDGLLDPGEVCDDGNLVSGDGCDANCTPTACGNSIITSGEVCDDGNVVNGDGCDANCTVTACGNGIVTAGETCDAGPSGSASCDPDCTAVACGDGTTNGFAGEHCDDGNIVSGDGCDANCTLTACGNGIQTAGEACDDGNVASGDGCDANCTLTACGNGIKTAGEACDDGNLTSGDGCDANCTVTACGNGVTTAGEACDDGNLISGDGCDGNCTPTGCGNGIPTAGEQCDDGNLISNDGCDANCTAPACGNSIINPPELCDDGNSVNGDGCDNNCTITACGNGAVSAPEQCDDGNLTSGDGCDVNCTLTACGNGIVTAGETCDDGNVVPGDGCRANCTVELCGDGTVDATEQCDDGNLVSGDGCDANCKSTGCGNGVITPGEQCDDGNLVDGDTCSSTCQRELLNPVPAAGDRFGAAVAAAGANIAVGVPLHDQAGAINTGLAYLYSGVTFQPVRIFSNPTADPGDEFGFALAVVGENIVIGAPFDDTTATDAGAVYMFNGITGALVRTIPNPDANGSKHFGWSIATLDNDHIVIGAPVDDVGTSGGGVVYRYNVTTGSLQQVYLNPTPSAGDEFGFSVAVAGGKILVGAPGHDIAGGGFNLPAPGAGAAFLFDATSGTLLKTIEDPSKTTNDRFGQVVSGYGADLLVGAPHHVHGAVYRINATTGAVATTYAPSNGIGPDAFGTSIAVAGAKIVIGAINADGGAVPSSGIVELFDAQSGVFLQQVRKPTPVQGDEFGWAVAVSGSHIVVGAPKDDTVQVDAGAIYFFPDNSCGNGGPLDPGEQCDDGNLVNGDGCDANCTFTSCGNGVVTAPEECDDGNNLAGDGCSPICGLEGACGDGVKSAFEQCDDGNQVNGDGCDNNCTTSGCGNGIKAGAEQCDTGVAVGTDLCCSATCQLIDFDHDGICDRDDVCPNTLDPLQSNLDGDIFGDACDICPLDVNNDSDNDLVCVGAAFNPPAIGMGDACSRSGGAGAWVKPRALFQALGSPGGDDRMRLKGVFQVANLLPAIQPDVYGVRVRVSDKNGNIVVDEKINGGTTALRGWKVSGAAKNQWTFTDRTKPPVQNGISSIIIRQRTFVDPHIFSVAVQGNGGTYPLQPGLEPVQITIELNSNAFPPGGTPGRDQCGEIQFNDLEKPKCKFIKFKLSCK